MPPGNKSGQAGHSVPLQGESEIRGQTTGIDILTITAPSTMDGDYLVLRSNVSEGSTMTNTELFVVSSAGGVTMSGTLNIGASGVIASSAGLDIGPTTTAQFRVTSGGVLSQFRLQTTALATGANTTAPTIGSTQSGRIVQLGGWASAARITLPTAAAGLNYMFSFIRKGAGAVSIAGAATGLIQCAESTGADAVTVSTARELNCALWMYSDGTQWITHVLPDGSSLMHAATAAAAIVAASS